MLLHGCIVIHDRDHLSLPFNLAQSLINGLAIEFARRLLEQADEIALITLVAPTIQRVLPAITPIGSVVTRVGNPITLNGKLVSSVHPNRE